MGVDGDAGNLNLGSATDSSGAGHAHDPVQVPRSVLHDEAAETGYTWIELGPYGYPPTDPAKLCDNLALIHDYPSRIGNVHQKQVVPRFWPRSTRRTSRSARAVKLGKSQHDRTIRVTAPPCMNAPAARMHHLQDRTTCRTAPFS
jgi:hypothetical protein